MSIHAVLAPLNGGAQDLDLPAFDLGAVLTESGIAPAPFIAAIWMAGLYLIGVWLLRRRGDKWPMARTFAFVGGGVGSFLFATCSGLAAYDTTLLSAHMVQHMILSMVVPIFLALGGPVTLALRTLPPGPRRWLNTLLHSWFAKVLSFAPLAFALYVLSPWALYFTSWYEASLRSDFIHEAMHFHLVVVGTLFFWPLVGVDPLPGRVSHPARMLLAVLTLPFHAFLGVTVMGQKELLAGDWYRALREGPMASWLPVAADDQELAGRILWGSGDLIGLFFFGVIFVQWVRASMKEAEQVDRRLDLMEARAKKQER